MAIMINAGDIVSSVSLSGGGTPKREDELIYTLTEGGVWKDVPLTTFSKNDICYVKLYASDLDEPVEYYFIIRLLAINSSYTNVGNSTEGYAINLRRMSNNENTLIQISLASYFSTTQKIELYRTNLSVEDSNIDIYRASGTFISSPDSQGIVEINCGFKPNVIDVILPFSSGNTYCCVQPLLDGTMKSLWIIPMERNIYDVFATNETGVCEITNNGFKFRSNAANTRGVTCSYIAYK